jgi:hypothetical protein
VAVKKPVKPLASGSDAKAIQAAVLSFGNKYGSTRRPMSHTQQGKPTEMVAMPTSEQKGDGAPYGSPETSNSYMNSDTFDNHRWETIEGAVRDGCLAANGPSTAEVLVKKAKPASTGSSIGSDAFDDRRWQIIEGAARAGCLARDVALAVKIPVANATPPGLGLEKYCRPHTISGALPTSPGEYLVDAIRDPGSFGRSAGYFKPPTDPKITSEAVTSSGMAKEIDSTAVVSKNKDTTSGFSLSSAIGASVNYIRDTLTASPQKPGHEEQQNEKIEDETALPPITVTSSQGDATSEKDAYIAKNGGSLQAAKRMITQHLKPTHRVEIPGPSTELSANDNELKGEFFDSWPTVEKRSGPPTSIRRAKITCLPVDSNPKFVASLVYGGKIESITVGSSSADVLFVEPNACKRFCDENANGISYGKEKHQFVLVDAAKEPEVLSSRIRELVDNGGTRVVRAIGENRDLDLDLKKLLSRREVQGLKMDHFLDEILENGARKLSFRFCKLSDANLFKMFLERDEDWETFNVQFDKDPCDRATNDTK